MIHQLTYSGQDEHDWLYEGPEKVDFQLYCESLICLAADNALKNCKKRKVLCWGSDVMEELHTLINARGIFKPVKITSIARFNHTSFNSKHETLIDMKIKGLSQFHVKMIKEYNDKSYAKALKETKRLRNLAIKINRLSN